MLNPLLFQLLQKFLDGTGYTSVRDYVLHEGEAAVIAFAREKLTHHLDAQAEAITAKMIKDGWEVGRPHPKTHQPLTTADLLHDLPYRLVRSAGVPGGFLRDTFRDATDVATRDALLPSVPNTPTVEWVKVVIDADIAWWASVIPQA
jgi:hypothetical protein